MNGYIAIYLSKRVEIRAKDKWAAVVEARKVLKVPKSRECLLAVELAERADGSEVVHTAVN